MSNRSRIALVAMVVVCICFLGTHALSQDKDKPADATGGMDPAMMQAWMEASTPGAHQKALEPMVGNFTYTLKFKMDPSQDWTTSEGTYEGNMAMDGRYLLTDVKGDMMGSQFHGMGCLAYDNVLKKYVSAWIDNMGTGIMRTEGAGDAANKVITFEGKMMDPMTRKETAYKYVYEIKSNDAFTMRWWQPGMADGKMFESMVIEYTREK